MLNEKENYTKIEEYLKKLGLPVVQQEVGIGKRRLRPDLVGYSLNNSGDLIPQVIVEVKTNNDFIKGQQQLMYYAQHLDAPYALLATPANKVWFNTKTFLQTEEPTFKSESEFYQKEEDIITVIRNATNLLRNVGILPYDCMWTIGYCLLARTYLHENNRLSNWTTIENESEFLEIVQSALNDYKILLLSNKFEIRTTGLKPEEFKKFISNFNIIPPKHTILKQVIFSLIEDIGARYAGQYLTPANLRILFVNLAKKLNLSGKDAIDLTSGFGGLAFNVLDYIPLGSLTTIELNHEIWSIAKIISIISGYENIDILYGNAIYDDKDNATFNLGKYSCVFVDPPFIKITSEEDWYKKYAVTDEGRRKRVEAVELLIERALELAKDDGNGYIITLVPEGILFNSNSQITRDLIKKKAIIEAIISLPGQTLRPYTGIKTSILVLRKKRSENEIASNLFIAQPETIEEFEEVIEGFAEWKRGNL